MSARAGKATTRHKTMRQACASCGGDKIPWRRGWTIDEVGSRALLCNACGLRWSAGRLRRVDDVPSEPPRKKKRKTSLPAAAARLPVAARVAPPCFGPRESGSGDDGATEDDGAKEVNPQAARRRSLKANLPAPAAEPFEGENLPEPFHPSAVPRLLRFLGDGRWCRYVTFREVRSVDDAGVRRRTFRLVAEDRSELDAVVGTDTLDGKYAYETCDELVTQGMDRVGRPFTSPPQPGHLRNARDAAAFCRAVVHASGTAPPAFCTNAADARRSDADIRSILARTDAVDTADTTWRDVEHTLGPKMWRWATGSAGELASARLAEMVRRVDEGIRAEAGRRTLTARDAAEIVSELRCVWMKIDGGVNMETLEETGIVRALVTIAGSRSVAKETSDAAAAVVERWRSTTAKLVASLEGFVR